MAVVSRSDLSPPLATADDSRLVLMARGGDQHAFELLVHRHHRRLLARVRRVLPPDRADDALQNGLLSAWLALQRGTEVKDARPWLERIVHNAALRALPSAGHAELSEAIGGIDDGGPAAALDRRQQLHDALVALASLPELQREALLQTALDGRSYEEAARSLGINQSTVRGLVYRARNAMRSALGALVPLPALGRLFRRRGSAADRSDAAVRVGASAHPGGLGAIAAKGAVAVLIAAGGFGASQLIAGHSTSAAGAQRTPHAVAQLALTPLRSGPQTVTTTPHAERRHNPPRRQKRVRRSHTRHGAARDSAAPAPSGLVSARVNQTVPVAAAGAPTNTPVRQPVAQRSASAPPISTVVTATASPGSAHGQTAPTRYRKPSPKTMTGSSQGSSDGGGDPTDTTTTSTDTTSTATSTTGTASTSSQSGS